MDFNSLLAPYASGWHDGGGRITFSFLTAVPRYYSDRQDITGDGFSDVVWITPWNPLSLSTSVVMSATEKEFTHLAVQAMNEVADIGLVEGTIGGSNVGDITFASARFGEAATFGFAADFPGTLGVASSHGDIWLNRTNPSQAVPRYGDTGWHTILHELGHALGLTHPDEDPNNFRGDPRNNQQWTMMSYVPHPGQADVHEPSAGWPVTPMMWDIQALQAIYGPNLETRTGATTYFGSAARGSVAAFSLSESGRLSPAFPAILTIWDAGGIDTISADNQTARAVIDLNNGAFSTIGLVADNIGIAEAVMVDDAIVNLIENAVGGGGDDRLTGNGGDNRLDGGAGADRMYGNGGDDLFIVDATGDRVVERAGGGVDTVHSLVSFALTTQVENLALKGTAAIAATGSSRGNALTGNGSANFLDGGGGADKLKGGDGSDRLDGGSHRDTMMGGAGADRFLFDDGDSSAIRAAADRIVDFDSSEGDRIDLRAIDARSASPDVNNAFRFLGADAFSGNGRGGELRFQEVRGNIFISGDVDGDGVGDFVIRLDGVHDLVATDFLL